MKVIGIGNLTRDPEVRYGNDGALTVARFSIASQRRFKREGEPEADFFNCTAFGKTAEFVEKYLKKGSRIFIEGRLQNDNYTNKDGQQVYAVQVLVDEIEFGEKKGNGTTDSAPAPAAAPAPATPSTGFMNIPDGIDDELPFN